MFDKSQKCEKMSIKYRNSIIFYDFREFDQLFNDYNVYILVLV